MCIDVTSVRKDKFLRPFVSSAAYNQVPPSSKGQQEDSTGDERDGQVSPLSDLGRHSLPPLQLGPASRSGEPFPLTYP